MSLEDKEITAYLVDYDTRERLEFQYNPNEIVDDKGTDYATIKIPGMSHPRYQFVAGEPRKINFKVVFFKGDVKKKVHWLRSLLYPEHAGTMLKNAPHRVLFFFGDLYPGVLCIVKQVRARYFHLFGREDLMPEHAEVDLQLEEYVKQSVSYKDVRI